MSVVELGYSNDIDMKISGKWPNHPAGTLSAIKFVEIWSRGSRIIACPRSDMIIKVIHQFAIKVRWEIIFKLN